MESVNDSELELLGLQVLNQQTYEEGVLAKIDAAFTCQEIERQQKNAQKELLSISANIRVIEKELMTFRSNTTNGFEYEKKVNERKALIDRKLALVEKLDRLSNKDSLANVDNADEHVSHSDLFDNDVGKTDSSVGNVSELIVDSRIRCGEITPFEMFLSDARDHIVEMTKTISSSEIFLDTKPKLNNDRDSNENNATSNENLLRPIPSSSDESVDEKLPKKRKWNVSHDVVGNIVYSDDDVDYVPDKESASEESLSESWTDEDCVKSGRKKRSRKTNKMTPEDLEEQYMSSSDSSSMETGRFKQGQKKKRKVVRLGDDGDEKMYERRVRRAHKKEVRRQRSHIKEAVAEQEPIYSDAEFDEGFRVPGEMWNKLYRYQKTGVRWLWELHCQRAGGILGDEMGLGKTIQVICFLAGLRYSKLPDTKPGCRSYRGLGPVLVVCPATVMHQWVREVNTWWSLIRIAVLHASGSYRTTEAHLVESIVRCRGILVTGYSTLLIHRDLLLRYDWHYVILDEGHKIRNPDAQATLVCKQFRTCHRIILSGSPMQNNLKELWSLFDFVFPGKLGTLPDFLQQFSVPIVQGGYANATDIQVTTAYRCACVLRDTIAPYLLQRMKSDVQIHIDLPTKSEQVLFCRLTDHQRQVYQEYLDSKECHMILNGNFLVFPGLITLRKICNHPDLSTGDLIVHRSSADVSNDKDWDKYGYWRRSGKMIVVESLLKLWKKQNHKVLLFTQSRQMLNILESFVLDFDYTYLRMDGATDISTRQPLVNRFNTDDSIFLFLLTTRVGGLGINLTGADRVIIFDPDWNPSTDTQARERAWRIGQTKPVTIYRLLTTGTIEEKILHRQIFKQFLTNRVLRDPRQRRFFKSNDLFELFSLGDDNPQTSTETGAIFAGTSSDVRLKKSRRINKPGRSKRKNIFDNMKETTTNPSTVAKNLDSKDLEEEKIARMKELAKKLSQRLVQQSESPSSSGPLVADVLLPDSIKSISDRVNMTTVSSACDSQQETGTNNNVILDSNNSSSQTAAAVSTAAEVAPDNNKVQKKDVIDGINGADKHSAGIGMERKPCSSSTRHKKHRKRKRTKDVVVDGERIVFADKLGPATTTSETLEERSKSQDDYVLQKIFSKSGIHSAMHHDKIMMSAKPDYMLIEAEAERVACEAARILKQSRLRCQQNAQPGLPTWTGQHGVLGAPAPRLRFGQKKNSATLPLSNVVVQFDKLVQKDTSQEFQTLFDGSALIDNNKAGTLVLSSAEILSRMRSRNNRNFCTAPNTTHDLATELPGNVISENIELITDIRNYVAFGGQANGQATTKEILDQFRDRISQHQTINFKAMLKQICTFDKLTGTGIWSLKPEFK